MYCEALKVDQTGNPCSGCEDVAARSPEGTREPLWNQPGVNEAGHEPQEVTCPHAEPQFGG